MGETYVKSLSIDFRLNKLYIYHNNGGEKIVLECVREVYAAPNGNPTWKFRLLFPLKFLEDANIYRLPADPDDVYSFPEEVIHSMEFKGQKIKLLKRQEWAKIMLKS